jgi:hypothetical protein
MGVAVLVLAALVMGGATTPRAERTAGDLRLEVVVTRATFRPGDAVGITMRITNAGPEPVVLTAGGQQYDFLVRQRGALVWLWSHDKAFAQVVRTLRLASQETLTYQATWDQRDLQGRLVEPGTYEIFGVLMATPRPGSGNIEVGPARITIGR